MLLTSMPGAMDYFFLASVFFLAFSLIVSIVIIGVIVLIKKDGNPSKNYFVLWLKIFGIMFLSLELLSFIVLVAI